MINHPIIHEKVAIQNLVVFLSSQYLDKCLGHDLWKYAMYISIYLGIRGLEPAAEMNC